MKVPDLRNRAILLLSQERPIQVAALAMAATLVFVALGCSTPRSRAATLNQSVRSGVWSDASVWSLGHAPSSAETARVMAGHTVTYNAVTATVAGVYVDAGGSFVFDHNTSLTLESTKNVIIHGLLRMKPARPSFVQTLRFRGVDETRYVGNTMDPVDSDVGLWVMGNGKLDLTGSPKRSWTRTTVGVNQGATSITLGESPDGWQAGDEIVIAPTALNDFSNFDPRSVSSVSGNTVTLASGVSGAHPAASFDGRSHSPEVMNMTRNVRIEGTRPAFDHPRTGKENTSSGRAHIFIRSNVPQVVNYVAIRYMGPRKASTNCWIGTDCSEIVKGRYGLHFHRSFHGSRGSLVEGTVIRDTGSTGFVPHASHGITFKNTISYAAHENAYWWDPPRTDDESRLCTDANCADGLSDDIVIDHAVAALVLKDELATDSSTGFALQKGLGNAIRNSVAVGLQGNISSGGYAWHEGSSNSPWQFLDNLAHNNAAQGIFWWQVDGPLHPVERFISYRNGTNMTGHGAYLNSAHYTGFRSYQDNSRTDGTGHLAPIHSIALTPIVSERYEPRVIGQHWKDGLIEAAESSKYGVHFGAKAGGPESPPMRWERLTVRGYAVKPIVVRESNDAGGNDGATVADLVCWNVGDNGRDLQPSDFDLLDADPPYVAWDDRIVVRVQRRDGTAFKLSGNKQWSTIPKFSDCGTGPAEPIRPTAPTNLSAKVIQDPDGSRKVELNWQASMDDTGVTGYRVVRRTWDRSDTYLTSTNSLIDTRLRMAVGDIHDRNSVLAYNITANDASGNISDPSTTVYVNLGTGQVTAPSPNPTPSPTPTPSPDHHLVGMRAEDSQQL